MSKLTIQHCIEINREKITWIQCIMPKVDRGVSRLFDNIFGRVLQTIYHERTSKFDRDLGGLQVVTYNYPVLNWHHLHHTLHWHHYISEFGDTIFLRP